MTGVDPCERWPETPAGLFGWQGIVPCKVRKMSTTMVDLMTKRLLDVRAVFGGVRGGGGPSVHLTRTRTLIHSLTHSSVHMHSRGTHTTGRGVATRGWFMRRRRTIGGWRVPLVVLASGAFDTDERVKKAAAAAAVCTAVVVGDRPVVNETHE